MLTLATSFKCILSLAKKNPYYEYFEDGRPRGLGAELRLFDVSPDKTVEQASIE